MFKLARVAGAFLTMMVVGYVVMVAFLPAPAPASFRDADDGAQSAAVRLSAEAQALVRKPAGTLQ